MAGPWDVLTLDQVPDSVQVWALAEMTGGPYSLDLVDALRVPGLDPARVIWDPLQVIIAGAMAVRRCVLELGPVAPGSGRAAVEGLAFVDTSGNGLLGVTENAEGTYYLEEGQGPLTLSAVCSVYQGAQ